MYTGQHKMVGWSWMVCAPFLSSPAWAPNHYRWHLQLRGCRAPTLIVGGIQHHTCREMQLQEEDASSKPAWPHQPVQVHREEATWETMRRRCLVQAVWISTTICVWQEIQTILTQPNKRVRTLRSISATYHGPVELAIFMVVLCDLLLVQLFGDVHVGIISLPRLQNHLQNPGRQEVI